MVNKWWLEFSIFCSLHQVPLGTPHFFHHCLHPVFSGLSYTTRVPAERGPDHYSFIHSVFQIRHWHPTLVLSPGKSHGQRSPVGCCPWGRTESDTTEQLDFHLSFSFIGEGNGNPLQCSCLENPRDRGAWWAAVYGVAQSRTRLKRLSSSSSSSIQF